MIDYEIYAKIKNYSERAGLKYTQIADILSLDPRTVARWATIKQYQPRKPTVRKSKLDPYKDDIVRMLEKYPYSAVQIFQKIKETGFDGSITIVENYVRKVRPPKRKAYLKLSFAPGECAQVDWGSYGSVRVGSTTRRLSFFVMVLCYSRMMYVEFTVSQKMEQFLGCHQNAFQFFGAIPKKIMIDNLKTGVLKRIVGQAPVFNPKYIDFAKHYDFSVVACNVGKGNEKGQVENGVKYIKKNLLGGFDISDFKIMKPVALNWLDTIANVRTHKETGKKPVDMFTEEKASLLPLPVEPYDIATVKQIRASKQFRVAIDANQYSVPAQLSGVGLTAKIYPDRICLYHENKLVARHTRSYDRLKDFELPDHPKMLLQQRKRAKEQKIFMRFLALSEKSQDYYRELEQRRMNPLHHIRQIVALSEIYSTDQVKRAIEDAFLFSAFSCEYIANLLEQHSRPLNEPGALHLTRNSDLLELTIDHPDLSIYNKINGEKNE